MNTEKLLLSSTALDALNSCEELTEEFTDLPSLDLPPLDLPDIP